MLVDDLLAAGPSQRPALTGGPSDLILVGQAEPGLPKVFAFSENACTPLSRRVVYAPATAASASSSSTGRTGAMVEIACL